VIEIKKVSEVNARLSVPGSKSITQRALIAAALADGESRLIGPLASEDTHYTAVALRSLGIMVEEDETYWLIQGQGGKIIGPARDIYLGNNGTATRFLTSVAALGSGVIRIIGDRRMEERPIEPLIRALQGWGVKIRSIKDTGCPPLEINAAGIAGGTTVLPEGKSSQYLSSLLLVAPYARNQAELVVQGEVLSKPYVAMTLAVMKEFGLTATTNEDYTRFTIPQGRYRAREYNIEGDASNASYFWAAAAVTGGRVTIVNIPEDSLQGDTAFVALLARMGCKVESSGQGITVIGPSLLQGIEVDMGNWPDVVPTLAMVAARAQGRTVIKNIAHLRIKECDRLHVVAKELGRLGVRVQEYPDTLVIEGLGPTDTMHGAEITTYNDHRIAMSFAVCGLVVEGVKVLGEECVVKSFPDFWQRFELLYDGRRSNV